MLTGIDAVIFDLDGTLVDSMWIWKAIDIEYLKRFGAELPDNLQKEIEGMSFSETAVYFKERFQIPDEIEQIKATWNEMALMKYQTEIPLKAGALSFLKYLKKQGIKTGIATSNSRELVEAAVESLKIKEYFDAIHTSCEVPRGKPAPDIYLFVSKNLSVPPERCMVFEDIPAGILAGKAAGMKVCAVQDDFSRKMEEEKRRLADYFIDCYSDVL